MKKTGFYSLLMTIAILIASCSNNNTGSSGPTDTADSLRTDTLTTVQTTGGDTSSNGNNTQKIPETGQQTISPHFDYSGVIMMKADEWVIRVTNGPNDVTDYYPKNLGEEFKVEGLAVQFNGTLGEIPPNVRMMGRPITLTEIQKSR
jgi:hypothetical protein